MKRAPWLVVILAVLSLCLGAFAQSEHQVIVNGASMSSGKVPVEQLVDNPHWVHVVVKAPDGTIKHDEWTKNQRNIGGRDWQINIMACGATSGLACNNAAITGGAYLALSTAALDTQTNECGGWTGTPATTPSTCTDASELDNTRTLGRALATYAHTGAAGTYTLSKQWTCTSSNQSTGIVKTEVWSASTGGTRIFSATISSVTLNVNDTLTVTWTIDLGA